VSAKKIVKNFRGGGGLIPEPPAPLNTALTREALYCSTHTYIMSYITLTVVFSYYSYIITDSSNITVVAV